ncbi:hypothetical protein ABES01_21640, partial [Paenibacillus rhizolycopersici]|uniref:hypothetical protein n=1 Tax=Paenibacillus rhizolycopersici TaxID=2780073 RepID=UPI003D2B6D96
GHCRWRRKRCASGLGHRGLGRLLLALRPAAAAGAAARAFAGALAGAAQEFAERLRFAAIGAYFYRFRGGRSLIGLLLLRQGGHLSLE